MRVATCLAAMSLLLLGGGQRAWSQSQDIGNVASNPRNAIKMTVVREAEGEDTKLVLTVNVEDGRQGIKATITKERAKEFGKLIRDAMKPKATSKLTQTKPDGWPPTFLMVRRVGNDVVIGISPPAGQGALGRARFSRGGKAQELLALLDKSIAFMDHADANKDAPADAPADGENPDEESSD